MVTIFYLREDITEDIKQTFLQYGTMHFCSVSCVKLDQAQNAMQCNAMHFLAHEIQDYNSRHEHNSSDSGTTEYQRKETQALGTYIY